MNLLISELSKRVKVIADLFERLLKEKDVCENSIAESGSLANFTAKELSSLYSQTIVCLTVFAKLVHTGPNDFSWPDVLSKTYDVFPIGGVFNSLMANPEMKVSIEELIYSLNLTNLEDVSKKFNKGNGISDLFTVFYEDFLSQYDSSLRAGRGVWHTPDPVVRFIVRVVHILLVEELGLSNGLADSTEIEIDVNPDSDKKIKAKIGKLQVLDPATGTGTFLIHILLYVHSLFKGQHEAWCRYVEGGFVRRLTGYEVLITSHIVACLKVNLALKDTGYGSDLASKVVETRAPRIILKDTLKEDDLDGNSPFGSWLGSTLNNDEGEKPIIVVIGNPPYSGISYNSGGWIESLVKGYKYVDGTHFGEKKHWLHDDYVKFIRYGEYLIERTGEGVLAYINNHSFIDNPTFRGMRWHLLQTFDKIYIVNLHGNALKKEVAPDGSKDENVFDIQQGVSINIFVKKKSSAKRGQCQVYYADAWGSRDSKYDFLDHSVFGDLEFIEVKPIAPQYFFYPQDTSGLGDYNKGVSLSDLFPFKTVACVTGKDSVNISWTSDEVANKINFIINNGDSAIRSRFGIGPRDARDWTVQTAKEDAKKNFAQGCVREFYYRPFDLRWTCYTGNSRGLYASPQKKVMQHLISCDNIALVVNKQIRTKHAAHALVTNALTGYNILETANANPYVLPLLLSLEADGQHSPSEQPYLVNINEKIAQSIAKSAGLTYNHSAQNPLVGGEDGQLTPIDILDYCYAVLHSNQYRTRYREYLNSDFPRIPLPHSQESMLQLVSIGSELRRLHLFDQSEDWELVTSYPVAGSNCVESKMTLKSPGWKDLGSSGGRVFINASQYFDGVTEEVWEFYVGAYQPAQKWLKDRVDKKLSYKEIKHYQSIIFCINRTIKLMSEIEKVGM